MNDERTEELLKEIAAKHGVALDRQDPILIVQTLHMRLLAESRHAQQTMLEDYRATLEAMLERWGAESKAKAERIVTATLTASMESMKAQMATTTTDVASAIRKEVRDELSKTETKIRTATTLGYVNLLAALVTCVAAVVVYWTLHS